MTRYLSSPRVPRFDRLVNGSSGRCLGSVLAVAIVSRMVRASAVPAMVTVFALLAVTSVAVRAATTDTTARAAIVMDMTTGAVLMEKNASMPLPPASMSKLMTLYLLFDALRERRVSLETQFQVSRKAAEMGGSKMFLREGENVSVENLIRGVIVQSGNDASVTIAENLAGTEDAFVRFMNVQANKMGLENSTFANSTGWPHPRHLVSAQDMVLLAERVIRDFPEFYGYFKEPEFTWDGVTQANRNPLLGLDAHVDGLKTGHTQAAGYGLVGSAFNGQRRIIFAVFGMESASERQRESLRLVNWAFREFSLMTIVERGERIATANVALGDRDEVGLISTADIVATAPFWAKEDVTLKLRYAGPLEAPVKAGDSVAELLVTFPEMPTTSYPLQAESDVGIGGVVARIKAVIEILVLEIAGLVPGSI
ncbi:MAG: D-alanyl-D-alanine carboxypeptidase [Paracoccaceae bacterium]|nr:D-alanyl-D-alanine carboxypeptidase [Paracoccaceae bacterium]MDE2912466.1 D-alanyl-D-alanine carboxypeptidase [Paracoccaceae bacterium]